MTILVVAEHSTEGILDSTRSAITVAGKIDNDIHVLVVGDGCVELCANKVAKINSVTKVLAVSDIAYKNFLAENMATLIESIADDYTHILAPSSTFGKDFMPRLAALLDVSQISDIVDVKSADTFVRPIYAGNVMATVCSSDKIKIITVRSTAFDKVEDGDNNAEIINIEGKGDSGLSEFIELSGSSSDRPDLISAKIVVSGGRGVGSAENFAKVIESLADQLGAAVGASRVAVDSGYVPNDMQVGQTGKIVAPELYIAVGISGAIQHLAGMKDSKVIVAINNDENAPIFEIADYGLVADLFEAVPELVNELSK